jgi:PilZ domain
MTMRKQPTPPVGFPNSRNDSRPRERVSRNLRAAVRYELTAPVVFTWIDSTGAAQEKRGHTRDISPKGVFVFCSVCPPQGTSLEMSIYLSVSSEHSRDVRIEAQGCVLRVEPGAEGEGRGFSVRNYWVRYARVE